MIEPRSVVLGVVVTEKSERQRSSEGKYTFRVADGANKVEIRQAIERLFRVHVVGVTATNMPSKRRRMGMFVGRRPGWKKAVVTLKKGETIESLER